MRTWLELTARVDLGSAAVDLSGETERQEIGFDTLVEWLHDREGTEIGVSMQGPANGGPGNTGLHTRGVLRRAQGMQVIDARPGRILRYDIGDTASIQILEGDFVEADRIDDFVDRVTIISADFKEATLLFSSSASSTNR